MALPRIYTQLIGRSSGTAAGPVLLYTVPIDELVVVRQVVVFVDSQAETVFQLWIGSGALYFMLLRSPATDKATVSAELEQVLMPGDLLWFQAPNVPHSVTVTGWKLLQS